MKYISGIQALNIGCNLMTCGDWHSATLKTGKLDLRDSEKSVYGEWGIEGPKDIEGISGRYYVANHIRACLDLLEAGQFSLAQGMREDYICNEEYTPLILDKVSELQGVVHWGYVADFMRREYMMKWINYEKSNERRTTA